MKFKEKETTAMLLDIENYYGEHEGRLAPLLIFLLLVSAPVLLWVYFGFFVPAVIFFPVWIVYAIRVTLLTLGKEKERLKYFKDQLNDNYNSILDLLNIKTIHEDGLIEFLGNKVAYMLVLSNGTATNAVRQTRSVNEYLMPVISDKYDFDLLVQNINETSELEKRYNAVKFFTTPEAAQDFLDIIDYNRAQVKAFSMLNRIVIVLKGRKEDWKDMRMTLKNLPKRTFKDAHIALPEEVADVFSRDINGTLDLDDTLRQKYATHEYFGSKVIGYDLPVSEAMPVVKQENGGTLDFIPT
jgi:hypothetical protein